MTRNAPEEEVPSKRRKPAPDFDVVYTKKFPTGSTERSKRLLQKAAALESKSNPDFVRDGVIFGFIVSVSKRKGKVTFSNEIFSTT